jgi:hypothetical protein
VAAVTTAEQRAADWDRAVTRGGDDLRSWWELYAYTWDGPILYFDVLGNPIGQGRLTPVRIKPKGKKERLGNRASNEKILTPWREAIQEAAERACRRQRWQTVRSPRPIRLDSVFTLPAGPTVKKEGRLYPTVNSQTASDLDHYIRAAGDGISNATGYDNPTLYELTDQAEQAIHAAVKAVWADDAQIVEHRAVKTYPDIHPLALPVPGARFWIHTMLDSPDAAQ